MPNERSDSSLIRNGIARGNSQRAEFRDRVNVMLMPARGQFGHSQCHASQRHEVGLAGGVQRDIVPMLIDVDEEQTQRVDHDDRFEIQQALQEDKPLDVGRVRRFRLQLETSYPVVASVEAVLPLPYRPERDPLCSVAARRRDVRIARRCHIGRHQRLDRGQELVGRARDRDDVARSALLVQGFRDVKVNAVVVSVVHHRQFGREDVVVGRAQMAVRPDHGQNDLRRRTRSFIRAAKRRETRRDVTTAIRFLSRASRREKLAHSSSINRSITSFIQKKRC